MTKSDIKNAQNTAVDETLPSIPDNQELDQSELNVVTDAAAGALDTLNPNGPHYPSTPR